MLSHAPRGDGAPALSNAAQRAKSQGHNPGYDCFGQTQSGRYLFCVVIAFPDGNGFLVTARPMATQETRRSLRELGDLFHLERYDLTHSRNEDRYLTLASDPENRVIVYCIAWTKRTVSDGLVTRFAEKPSRFAAVPRKR